MKATDTIPLLVSHWVQLSHLVFDKHTKISTRHKYFISYSTLC